MVGDGAAFVGLPGNPVAVFVTFVRVVRPLLLRLAGALPEPLVAMPVRATSAAGPSSSTNSKAPQSG